MRRPKNWKQIIPKYPYTGYPTYRDGAVAIWEEAIEVGADAILRALKAEGQRVRYDKADDTKALLGFFEDCAKKDGWLVFISDEEVKNG